MQEGRPTTKIDWDDYAKMRAVQHHYDFKIAVGPVGYPRILVISHERSGTHFAMNSIAANLRYVASPWINLDSELGINFFSEVAILDFLKSLAQYPVRNILKSHHDVDFFRGISEYLLDHFYVLYVYRDVFSVMASFQRFLNHLAWNEGPKTNSLSDFIRNEPLGAMCRYQSNSSPDMVTRWSQHVAGWLEFILQSNSNSMLAISYEDLDRRFETTMPRIADWLGLSKPLHWTKPSMIFNVIRPCSSDPVRVDYQSWYSAEDREYILQKANPGMEVIRRFEHR